MDKTKTSIFSKIMAVISIIIAVILLHALYHGAHLNLLGDTFGIVSFIFIIIISLSVLFSWFPRLLSLKIIFLLIATVPIIVIIYMTNSMFYVLHVQVWHCLNGGNAGVMAYLVYVFWVILNLIVFFIIYWTISVMILHILPIKRKIWIIALICLFTITNVVMMLIPNSTGQL